MYGMARPRANLPGRCCETALSLLALAALLTAACGRPPVAVRTAPAATAPAVDADAIVENGCYRCLEEQMSRPALPGPVAFQVAILLAMRAKELGLPFQPWLDRAANVAPPGAEWQLYLEIADVVRVDPLAGDREEILSLTSRQRRPVDEVQRWRESLRTGDASPLFRSYLDLTLACSSGQRQEAIAAAEPMAGRPVIAYRIGTCGSPDRLVALRASHPEWTDVELALGRAALETPQPDQEDALRHLEAARVAFPASPLITASIGDVHRDREEWEAALAAYDATLTLVPTHRDALLGRTIALSNLSRHRDAVATADRLLDLGNWFVGAAYFWRAWNHYNQGDIATARLDIAQARERGRGAPTLVLSGMVAWREQRLDEAEGEFQEALDIDRGQCEAAALQGGVRAARAQWERAAESFQHAQQCFELSMAVRRKLIEDIEQGPGSAAGKASQVSRHQRAFDEARQQRDDAVRNLTAVRGRLRAGPR